MKFAPDHFGQGLFVSKKIIVYKIHHSLYHMDTTQGGNCYGKEALQN